MNILSLIVQALAAMIAVIYVIDAGHHRRKGDMDMATYCVLLAIFFAILSK